MSALTIVKAHKRLTKFIYANGSIDDYDLAKTFDLISVSITGLSDLQRLLARLALRADCAIVRGAVADPTRVKSVRRLLYTDKDTGDKPTLIDVPQPWLALDFDTLPQPGWINHEDLLGCAVVAIRALPAAFHHTRFIIQATSGHGLKPGIRLRLWCWLSRPTSTVEATYWLRKAPVDLAVFSTSPADLYR